MPNPELPHVLVVTTGSAGDLFPFLKLGQGLLALGHPVTVLAPHLHAPWVARAGLDFHGVSADPAVLDDPDLWHPQRGFGVVWRGTRPGMEDVRQFIAALPAGRHYALLVHPLAIADADLWRAMRPGMPVVAAFLAPSNLRTVHDPMMLGPLKVARWVPKFARGWLWQLIGKLVLDPVALPGLNRQRQALSLPPVTSLLAHLNKVPDLFVTLFPDWFAPPQPDWPQPLCMGDFALFEPDATADLSPALKNFLAAGSAPLVFTHGTGNRQSAAFFALALASAQRLGRRAIFLTPHRDQLPADLPAWAFWQDYCRLSALLGDVAVLIHHGGIGTTAEALRAGTPQLIVALAFDQFDNGARVAAAGAGSTVQAHRLRSQVLDSAIKNLLESETVKAACATVRARFEQPDAFVKMVASISELILKTGKI